MKKLIYSVALAIALAGRAGAVTMTLNAGGVLTDPSTIVLQSNSFATAGTGVIDPFLRIQKNETETGFNTSKNPPPGDAKASFTFDLMLSSLQIKTIGANGLVLAQPSYQISLDINQLQSKTNPLILLTTFDIYTGNTASRTTLGDSLIVSLTNDYFLTDINSGSGAGDAQFYIPVSLFAAHTTDKFFTLNAAFSNSDDGIEEFAAVIGPNAPHAAPEGGMTVALLGGSLAAIELLRRTLAKRATNV